MTTSQIFYQKFLFRYLSIYLLLNVGVAVCLIGFERGWLLFAYLWLFLPHLPFVLLGLIFGLVAKKYRLWWLWGLSLVSFILSNSWWVYGALQGLTYWTYLILIPLTLVPIWATVQLTRLTLKEKK